MVVRFLYQSLVRQSNSPCCYYTNTCLRGQKCNYSVVNQSDSSSRNSADFKFVCMQVYQTLLLLRVRGSGSETSYQPEGNVVTHFYQSPFDCYSTASTVYLAVVKPEWKCVQSSHTDSHLWGCTVDFCLQSTIVNTTLIVIKL